MVQTTLEAHVEEGRWEALREAYRAGQGDVPPQLVHSFILQDMRDPTLWRIQTLWRSREALDEMRRSVQVPAGVLMFRAAGAEPTLTIADVRETIGFGAAAG